MATKNTPKSNPKASGNTDSQAVKKAEHAKKTPSVTNTKKESSTSQPSKTATKRTKKAAEAAEMSDIKIPEFPTKEDFASYTDMQIMVFAENFNKITEDRESVIIDYDHTFSREQMIDVIVEAINLDNTKIDQGYAISSQKIMSLSLDKVTIHPDNPRQPVDYIDPDLFNSIKKSGGIIGLPVVVEAVNAGFEDPDMYYVIDGNRSFHNYKKYVTEVLKHKLEDHYIDFTVRTYQGTDKEIRNQIFYELAAANDKAQGFTVINRLELINRKVSEGFKKSAIAEEMGVSPANITHILSLNLLPKEILDRVHYEATKDRLCKLSQDQLKDYNVPFVVNKEGSITIEGITFKNALALVNVIPKKPARSNFNNEDVFEEAFAVWKSKKDKITQYFLDEKIINMAVYETEANFSKKLEAFLKEVHILPGGKNPPPVDVEPEKEDKSPKTSGNEVANRLKEEADKQNASNKKDEKDPSEVKANQPPKPAAKDEDEDEKDADRKKLLKLLYSDPNKISEMIDSGDVDFITDWQSSITKSLKRNDQKIVELVKLMINNNIIGTVS